MNIVFRMTLLLLLMISPVTNAADDYAYGNKHFENCLAVVMKTKPGAVIKVEMKIENDMSVYEFDIRDEENQDWDVECDADTAKVIEIEEETFGTQHPKFLKYMKISLEEAKTVALSKYPGEIIEIEYEIEEDGVAVYEFDINTDDGKEIKVEIDAASGNIHEETLEIWQIGYE
jgi:uncharacterized membrane protein YkoI